MSEARDRNSQDIEVEIEETRDELSDTVADLADRADSKKQASKKSAGAKDRATEKIQQIQASLSATSDQEGSGGDIGSGPTGDVRNSPGIIDDGPSKSLAVGAGAFAAGLLAGWLVWH